MQINRVALDLAKQVIQMHAVDRSSKVLVRKPLRRAQLLPFSASLRRVKWAWRPAVALIIGRGSCKPWCIGCDCCHRST